MGKHSEQQSAARQFYANAPRPRSALEVCQDECDEAGAVMVDEWAERLVRGGVARLLAQQCAGVVVAVLREKDAAVAARCGQAVRAPAVEELLEGLRMIALKIYQAPKRGVEAGALILATGSTHADFASARELAEAQSVSHELTANAVESWQKLLGLQRTSGQKSDEARESYKNTNGRLGRKAA